jgi:hypothetical protein
MRSGVEPVSGFEDPHLVAPASCCTAGPGSVIWTRGPPSGRAWSSRLPLCWVPTKMGGAAATGNLETGYLTQTWLAVSNDETATASGGYWYHRQRQAPAPQARNPAFQDQLIDRLASLTGIALF